MDSSLDQGTTAQRYSGTALISLACAVVALVLAALVPLIGLMLAVAAVVSALLARRESRADPAIRGVGISLAGFLIGAGLICVKLVPIVLASVLWGLEGPTTLGN